jgi:hypothetical protein
MTLKQQSDELVAVHSKKGARATMRRIASSGRLARSIQLDVAIFDYSSKQDRVRSKNRLTTFYRTARLSLFQSKLEGVAESDYEAEIDSVKNLVTLLESRRTRELEIAIVILAAVLSGWIGAVIQGLLS